MKTFIQKSIFMLAVSLVLGISTAYAASKPVVGIADFKKSVSVHWWGGQVGREVRRQASASRLVGWLAALSRRLVCLLLEWWAVFCSFGALAGGGVASLLVGGGRARCLQLLRLLLQFILAPVSKCLLDPCLALRLVLRHQAIIGVARAALHLLQSFLVKTTAIGQPMPNILGTSL